MSSAHTCPSNPSLAVSSALSHGQFTKYQFWRTIDDTVNKIQTVYRKNDPFFPKTILSGRKGKNYRGGSVDQAWEEEECTAGACCLQSWGETQVAGNGTGGMLVLPLASCLTSFCLVIPDFFPPFGCHIVSFIEKFKQLVT